MEEKTARGRKWKPALSIVLCLAAAISGCVSGRPGPLLPAAGCASPEAALHALVRKAPPQGTLKAIAAIQVATPTGAYPLKLAVLLRRPASMRVEAIPVLGPPNFYLAIHEDRLKVLLPDKNEFYAGRATRENIAMFLPLRIDVESLVSLLMGIPPAVAEKDPQREASMEEGSCRIDIRAGGSRIQSLRVRPADGLIEGIDIYNGGERPLYRVRYEDPIQSGEFATPRKTVIVSEEDRTTLTIRYTEVEWSAEEDKTAFDLKVPPGVKEGAFP